MDDYCGVPWLVPHKHFALVVVAVVYKPTPLIPQVSHIPKHYVAVKLTEYISCVKE